MKHAVLVLALGASFAFATDMDHKGRVVAAVRTERAGVAEVACNDPRPQLWWGWNARYGSQLARETPIAVGFNSQERAPVALGRQRRRA